MLLKIKIKFLDEKLVQVMTRDEHAGCPGHAPHHIIYQKFSTVHFHNSRDNGSKSANDGKEAGKNNRLTSMLVIKSLGIIEMALLKK